MKHFTLKSISHEGNWVKTPLKFMNESFSKKHVLALNFNILTFASTQILLFTLFPYLAETLNISLSIVIGSFAFGTTLFIWGAPFWSSQVSKLGEYKVMTYGLLGLSLSFSLLSLLINFSSRLNPIIAVAVLILSRMLYGMMASAIVPVAQATRSSMCPHEENLKAMFTHSLYLNIGRTLGPILILISGEYINKLMLIISIWSFLLVLMNWRIANTRLISNTLVHSKINNWKESLEKIRSPLLITLLLTTFVGVLHSSLGEIIKESLGIDSLIAAKTMARLLLIGSFCMMLVQFLGKYFLNIGWKTVLLIGAIALTLGSLILIVMNNELMASVAMIFISVGIAFVQPGNLTMLKEASSKDQFTKNAGLLASGNTIGYALGGGISALLIGLHLTILTAAISITLLLYIIIMSARGHYAKC